MEMNHAAGSAKRTGRKRPTGGVSRREGGPAIRLHDLRYDGKDNSKKLTAKLSVS